MTDNFQNYINDNDFPPPIEDSIITNKNRKLSQISYYEVNHETVFKISNKY